MNLQVFLMFDNDKEKDEYRGFYSCDIDTIKSPLMNELINEFHTTDLNVLTELRADTMYINKKDRTFIPHECQLLTRTYKKRGFFGDDSTFLLTTDEIEKEETKEKATTKVAKTKKATSSKSSKTKKATSSKASKTKKTNSQSQADILKAYEECKEKDPDLTFQDFCVMIANGKITI
jgi:hypothetical protein